MGCDYYVVKLLHIYFEDEAEKHELELERLRGYYCDDDVYYDEDAEDYEKQLQAYLIWVLTPKMEPIVLYAQQSFTKPSFEQKYKTLIEHELQKLGKTWMNVTKILKVEERQ